MSQVTWKNVQGPNMGPAVQMAKTGISQVNSAVGAFSDIIEAQTAINNMNWDNQAKRNTADIQNRILGATTMNQLAALTPQLSPEKLRAEFGGQYDQAAVNRLLAERPKQLAADMMAKMQLDDLRKAELSKPYEDQFYALLASSPAAAAEYLQKNIDKIYNAAPLANNLQNIAIRIDTNEAREATTKAYQDFRNTLLLRKQEKLEYDKEYPRALEAAKTELGARGAELSRLWDASLTGEEGSKLRALGPLAKTYTGKTSADVLNDLLAIVKGKDEADEAEIMSDFASLASDYPTLSPVGLAYASLGAVQNPWGGDFGYNQSYAEERAEDLMSKQGKDALDTLKLIETFNAQIAGAANKIAAEKAANNGNSPTERGLLEQAALLEGRILNR